MQMIMLRGVVFPAALPPLGRAGMQMRIANLRVRAMFAHPIVLYIGARFVVRAVSST